MITGNVRDQFIKHIPELSEKIVVIHWMCKVFNYPKLPKNAKPLSEEGTRGFVFSTTNKRIIKGSIIEEPLEFLKNLYVCTNVVEKEDDDFEVTCEFLNTNMGTKILDLRDPIELRKGEILNFDEDEPIITTPAYILMNQRLLVEPFGDKIPFKNDTFSSKYLNDLAKDILIGIADKKITDLSTENIYKLFTNAYSLGQFAELGNKSFTHKSFQTSEEVEKLKKELLSKMSEQDKRDPIKIAEFEKKLIDADKKYLEGDDAKIFHDASGSSSYETHRKKLFITVGGIPDFDQSKNSYTFIEKSLSEGMDIKNFHATVNETRSGSHYRGKGTAKGGEQTKYILRIDQDLDITEHDCGTTRGFIVELHDDLNKPEVRQYIGSYEAETNRLIDEDYLKSKLGKIIKIRDAEHCETKSGLCFKCMNYNFEKIAATKIGTYIVSLSGGMLSVSMAAFHGTKIKTRPFKFEDHFYLV